MKLVELEIEKKMASIKRADKESKYLDVRLCHFFCNSADHVANKFIKAFGTALIY